MATPATKCQGFVHPVLLFMRSPLSPATQYSFYALGPVSCRRFTTAVRRCQQAKTKVKASPAIRTTSKPITPSIRPAASSSYAQALAQRPGGAILYEGTGQNIFIASSYAAGFVCMGGAAANFFFNVYNIPAGVPEWTAYAFGSVGLMLAILGMNFALKPSNVVRRIRILPAVETASKAQAGYSAPSKIQVEVLSRRLSPIPGIPLKREIVEPHDIILKARMFNPRPAGVPAGPTLSEEWIERKKEKADYDKNHRLTTYFRDFGWVFSQFLFSVRRGLTGEGFAPIEVNGLTLKLDITDAYVLEEGRAMDRILKVEQDDDNKAPLLFRKA